MEISFLYTPALKLEGLEKRKHLIAPSRVIVDLEDSIHVHSKTRARECVSHFNFDSLSAVGHRFGVRVNPLNTFNGLQDIAMLKSLYEQGKQDLAYVLIPKVSHASEVEVYRTLFSTLPFSPKLYSFIETVDAVDNAHAIAAASDGLCFGQADLAAEMYSPNATFIDYARARMCIAAARYRIPAIDTNSFNVVDMAVVTKECEAAKGYGFTGKAAIHPDHVPVINSVFSVTTSIIDKYESSIQAYEQAETGFALRDGEVIAPPFITKARRMLAFYKGQQRRAA